MNQFLKDKVLKLENAKDKECWYLVKHSTDFCWLCYLVTSLKRWQESDKENNVQNFIEFQINKINEEKNLKISNNYRALRVACFFGLLEMRSSSYSDAIITDTYNEITELCNGNYEDKEKYNHVIQRQIEKMFISSSIDEEYEGVRKNYRLYPILLLYKVLIEMGFSTGNFEISLNEYRYFVATTEEFKDYLDTLLYIKLSRNETDINSILQKYFNKFDNRMIQAIKQLDALEVSNDYVRLKLDYVDFVSQKVYMFEQNPQTFESDNYIGFLSSTKSLFDLVELKERISIEESKRIQGGTNILLYGVPGSGKSWTIENEYCNDENRMERLVFHPDYTYSDFVGQILPKVSDDNVSYNFTGGPFTNLLKKAYENPNDMFFLVIEEINRGNAPAIFGEVFQLLDRLEDGTSEYGITNPEVSKIVYKDPNKKVRIPSNMSIIGTMNTSDQNVFTLDTAFQRRWNMRLIENTFEKHEYAADKILDTDVTWQRFCEVINNEIITKNIRMTSSEDKRLGVYFVRATELIYHSDADNSNLSEDQRTNARLLNYRFAEKVIKYLWDDAFKFSREDIFKNTIYKSLEEVVKYFNSRSNKDVKGNARLDIFKDEIIDAFLSKEEIADE